MSSFASPYFSGAFATFATHPRQAFASQPTRHRSVGQLEISSNLFCIPASAPLQCAPFGQLGSWRDKNWFGVDTDGQVQISARQIPESATARSRRGKSS